MGYNLSLPMLYIFTHINETTFVQLRYFFTDTSYQLESPASRAHYLSGAAVDDCYEIASKSRLRDQALLSAANTAVVSDFTIYTIIDVCDECFIQLVMASVPKMF